MRSPANRVLSRSEAARRTCEESEFGALFVDCTGAGWTAGSFRLSDPCEIVEISYRGLDVDDKDEEEISPFDALEQAVESRPELVWGGFISYDAGRSVERIPALALADRQIPSISFVGYDCVEPVDPISSATYPSANAPALDEIAEGWVESLGKSAYERAVAGALERIYSGDFYQVNLARRVSARVIDVDLTLPAKSFGYLCDMVRPPRGCLLKSGEIYALSASPELFLSVDGRKVVTKPIKGTRPRISGIGDERKRKELASSAKDRAENVMIVDLLRNDLGKIAEFGSVRVPALCEVESFETVHHLVSTITCTLREDASLSDLLVATFPGGSITGAPKVAAMQFIEEVETVRRGVYTGAIGYIDPSGRLGSELGISASAPRIEFSIAIRTLVLADGWWDLWVGGGIVADSDPQLEWQETVDKSRGLAGALAGVEVATAPLRP
jgi:para-aminobenzoate synthetase component 1